MKKCWIVFSFIALSEIASAQGNTVLTLKQCVETGIANNLDVQQAGYQVQREEVDWKQSKLNLLPNVNGSANHGINQGRSIDPFTNSYVNEKINFANYSLGAGVVLFNGLSLQNYVKTNKLIFEAAKMDWQQAKDQLTIRIILAYLQVLSSEDQLVLARNQAEYSKIQVDRLIVLNNEGAIPPYQLSDLRGQYADDQVNIINAENALAAAKLLLCQLMNVPYDKTIQVEKLNAESFATRYDQTPKEVYDIALKEFSLVKARELRTKGAERAIKAIKGELFPTLSFNGSASTNYSSAASNAILLNVTDVTSSDYVVVNGNPSPVVYKQSNYRYDRIDYTKQLNNNLYSTLNLNLRIPIFNSLQTRNRIKMAKIDYKESQAVLNTTKTQLQQFIEEAHFNMVASSERHKALLDQVAAYTESFRATEVRFNAGLGTSIDYLFAKNNLTRASTNLIIAKYDFVLRTKVLDYYQGKQLW